jgi:hypothetical protein
MRVARSEVDARHELVETLGDRREVHRAPCVDGLRAANKFGTCESKNGAHILAVRVLPLGARIHRRDPRDGDEVLIDELERIRLQAGPVASEEPLAEPLRGLDDLRIY